MQVRWNLDRDLPLYKPRFNVAPETTPNIPVIVRQKGVNECRLIQWGLIPNWAADPSIGTRMINARAETLIELRSFKRLVDRRRCINSAKYDGPECIQPVSDDDATRFGQLSLL